jgi:hypothetical protein
VQTVQHLPHTKYNIAHGRIIIDTCSFLQVPIPGYIQRKSCS